MLFEQEQEQGTLDMVQIDELHNMLLIESPLYWYAYKNKLVGLVHMLRWLELDKRSQSLRN